MLPNKPRETSFLLWRFASPISCSCYIEDLKWICMGLEDGTIKFVSLEQFADDMTPSRVEDIEAEGKFCMSYAGATLGNKIPANSKLRFEL